MKTLSAAELYNIITVLQEHFEAERIDFLKQELLFNLKLKVEVNEEDESVKMMDLEKNIYRKFVKNT